MQRDGFTRQEAEDEISFAKSEIYTAIIDGYDLEQVLAETLGLEPDYLLDLIGL